jgi:hypothetical protein
MHVERNNEARSSHRCCHGKAKSITYSEYVFVAFVDQPAKRMRRIIFSSVVCPAVAYFSTLSHKRQEKSY